MTKIKEYFTVQKSSWLFPSSEITIVPTSRIAAVSGSVPSIKYSKFLLTELFVANLPVLLSIVTRVSHQ